LLKLQYERLALLDWLERSGGISPITREHIDVSRLTPNFLVKQMMATMPDWGRKKP